MSREGYVLSLNDRLVRAPERAVGLSLPLPISARLDDLVDRVESYGDVASRKDLVAALVLAAEADPEVLSRLLRNYRRARVRDAVNVSGDAETVRLHANRPGRRTRSPGLSGGIG